MANAYSVTFGGLLLLSGWAVALFGRRRLFIGVLGAGSVVGSVAGTAAWLITNWLGWRSTFGLNVDVGLLLAALALRVLEPSRPRRDHRGFDLGGAILITADLGLLAYAMVNTGVDGATSLRTLVPGGLAVLLLAAFVLVEARVRRPLVPSSVLCRPVLRTAHLLSGLAQFVMFFLIQCPSADCARLPAGGERTWLAAAIPHDDRGGLQHGQTDRPVRAAASGGTDGFATAFLVSTGVALISALLAAALLSGTAQWREKRAVARREFARRQGSQTRLVILN